MVYSKKKRHPEEMRVSIIRFVGEQDGVPEQLLKKKLVDFFLRDRSVSIAYLSRINFGEVRPPAGKDKFGWQRAPLFKIFFMNQKPCVVLTVLLSLLIASCVFPEDSVGPGFFNESHSAIHIELMYNDGASREIVLQPNQRFLLRSLSKTSIVSLTITRKGNKSFHFNIAELIRKSRAQNSSEIKWFCISDAGCEICHLQP